MLPALRRRDERGGAHPRVIDCFGAVDDGALIGRHRRDEEARVEATRHDRRRDPVRPVDQPLDAQEKILGAQQLGKQFRLRGDRPALILQTRGEIIAAMVCRPRRSRAARPFLRTSRDTPRRRAPGTRARRSARHATCRGAHSRSATAAGIRASAAAEASAAQTAPPGKTHMPPMNASFS